MRETSKDNPKLERRLSLKTKRAVIPRGDLSTYEKARKLSCSRQNVQQAQKRLAPWFVQTDLPTPLGSVTALTTYKGTRYRVPNDSRGAVVALPPGAEVTLKGSPRYRRVVVSQY